MKKLLMLSMLLMVVSMVSCANLQNQAKSDGGYFTSSTEDYIVISQSGGLIMDVWKLKDVKVSSPQSSDGWLFVDQYDNSINIGGDAKTIRRCSGLWDKYHEYHMEFETQTYREKFNK